jgi:flavin-dependent dehydrogenase
MLCAFLWMYMLSSRRAVSFIDDLAYVRIAIKPEMYIPYTMVDNTLVLGCGDSVVLNDPITGQGANTASYCAEQLYATLMEYIDSE